MLPSARQLLGADALLWLGVVIGANLQTSFLTPPFGFALFYLRGVTPKYIIQGYKQVCDIAERDADRLRSLDSLSKISGLFDTQENKTEELTVWAGFSPEQLDAIKDEKGLKDGKAKLLGKAKRESKEV